MPYRVASRYGSTFLVLCLTALVSLPLWFVAFPPLYDYPFHLARVRILHDIAAGGPLSRYYELNSFLVPSVAIDGLGLALQEFLTIEDAGRTFLFATMLLAIAGAAFLARTASGKPGAAPWLAAGMTYNWVFSAGFVNYLFAVALLPWAIGIYLRMRHASPVAGLSIGLILCLALCFSHLVAFAIYALVVATLEMQWGLRSLSSDPSATVLRWLVSALPLLTTAALFVALSPTADAVNAPVTWFYFGSAFDFIRYKTLWPVDALRSGNELVDVVSAIGTLALAVVIGWLGRLRIKREPLITIAILTAIFWAAPFKLFGAEYVDMRLPVVIFLLSAGFVDITMSSRRTTTVVAISAVALLAFRSVAIAADWANVERIERELTEAYRYLEPGSILFSADTEPGLDTSHWPQIGHFASLAEIVADAFVPATWAHPSQQSVRVNAAYSEIYEFQTPGARKVGDAAALGRFRRDIDTLMARRRESGRDSFDGHEYMLLLFPRSLGHTQLENAAIVVDHEYFILYRLTIATGVRQGATLQDR